MKRHQTSITLGKITTLDDYLNIMLWTYFINEKINSIYWMQYSYNEQNINKR